MLFSSLVHDLVASAPWPILVVGCCHLHIRKVQTVYFPNLLLVDPAAPRMTVKIPAPRVETQGVVRPKSRRECDPPQKFVHDPSAGSQIRRFVSNQTFYVFLPSLTKVFIGGIVKKIEDLLAQ